MQPDIQNAQLGAEFNYGQEMYIKAVRMADAVLAEVSLSDDYIEICS